MTAYESDFADGHYTFRLRHKELFELQDKCGTSLGPTGPNAIFERLRTGLWLVNDVVEPIRLGLIGGGLDAVKAYRLMKSYVHDQPLREFVPLAAQIVLACLVGPVDDPIKKKKARKQRKPKSSPMSSSDQTATAQVQQ